MKKTINAETAFDLVYALFQHYPWLLGEKSLSPLEQSVEHEAVKFILSLAKSDIRNWGNTNEETQNVVSGLLLDFLVKLKQPDIYGATLWEVSVKAEPWQQALEIIACEIRKAHPYVEDIH